MLCVVRGGKCLYQSVDLAGYTCASFSCHFVSKMSYGNFGAMGKAVPQMNATLVPAGLGGTVGVSMAGLATLLRMTGSQDCNNACKLSWLWPEHG